MVLFLLYFPKSASAASGGRMGRSSFSSRSSSSSRGSSSSSSSSRSSSSSGTRCSSDDGSFSSMSIFLTLVLLVVLVIGKIARMTSVIKLQVGLLGSARSLQRDLNRIAETADTSTNQGLTYILSETTLSILRHPDYCISGYSSVDVKPDMEDVETLFNSISIEERGKIDEETLVNSNNIKKKSTSSKESTGLNNEYIVITILVAAKGVYTMPEKLCTPLIGGTHGPSFHTHRDMCMEILTRV